MNRANHLARIQRVQKHRRCAKNLRYENSEQLAENVAQRQKIEEAQRVEHSFVAAIARKFFFYWTEIREEISVREHNAPGLRGGAGRKHNFVWVVSFEHRRWEISESDGG